MLIGKIDRQQNPQTQDKKSKRKGWARTHIKLPFVGCACVGSKSVAKAPISATVDEEPHQEVKQ
ncbi:hypothetical protein ARMA_1476 [Ardenticatena maritima]|uniref:Uncharacterized protein n=1 Tax=Ardenticatena maritima TaxID=872965 RepID=A0A0M8K6X6_9CHLR|nr:hypothetical protein ARMA_1476 [Ardenticatena maritima]